MKSIHKKRTIRSSRKTQKQKSMYEMVILIGVFIAFFVLHDIYIFRANAIHNTIPKPKRREIPILADIETIFNNLDEFEAKCSRDVAENWENLAIVPHHIVTNDMCIIALRQSYRAWNLVPKHLKTESMLLRAISLDPQVIKIAEHAFQSDDVIVSVLEANDITLLPYIFNLVGFAGRYTKLNETQ
jgi:hypothetical protein